MSLLAVENLDARHGLLQAVRDVSLEVAEGETLALVGANGAGKTTLLRTIAGAHKPAAGRVALRRRGHHVVTARIERVAHGDRARAGRPAPVHRADRRGEPSARRQERAHGTVDRRRVSSTPFRSSNRCAKTRAGNLSGGEQQATAIGRALMTNPRLLLLDEVSLGLAPVAVEAVYESLQALIAGGATLVLVEQDLGRALSVATRVLLHARGADRARPAARRR